MVLSLFPAMALAATATYPLWVGDVQVTEENAADTTGTRGWSFTPAATGDHPALP